MRAMPTRRILLKTTAKLAASSAFALNRATLARANLLGNAAAGTLPEVDVVLRTAVSAEDVPGVVAMAATEAGVVYEGVFGSRRLREGPRRSAVGARSNARNATDSSSSWAKHSTSKLAKHI